MYLTDDEKRLLDGHEGPARRAAMQLLVRYATVLGAERLVDTHNVAGGGVASLPNRRDVVANPMDMDATFALLSLDSDESFEIPPVKASTYKLIEGMDPRHWKIQGVSEQTKAIVERSQAFCGKIGISKCNTCTPYQVGNVPVFGEHCAWMESSAVVYINSVLGARTNCEGAQSTGAASLVGKIPYWGLHTPQGRRATHHVRVECAIDDMMDWGLMGYWLGETLDDAIPVLTGQLGPGELRKLKHFGAAAATSGGIEMYHLVGRTPEAPTLEAALGGRPAQDELVFTDAHRRQAYAHLNSATDASLDFIMLGCPHNSLEQLRLIVRLLEGRKVHADVALWIFTPNALRDVADRQGYTEILEKAGAVLMSDTCPALGRVKPEGARVVATDSCKQAHYLPATIGLQTHFGSVEDCIESAVAGRWVGRLR